NIEKVCDFLNYQILFDPQTSGGLLAAVDAKNANACVTQLQALRYPQATIIGRVVQHSKDYRVHLMGSISPLQ
ncbi:MAG: hypothetical protein H0U45_11435, partial [Tatlockia sp.]|nr:hypothetical protein [Tatlockia sp.]